MAMAVSSSQLTASKPEFTPQYGCVSEEAKVLASSLTPLREGLAGVARVARPRP